jgi:hypothetical protein
MTETHDVAHRHDGLHSVPTIGVLQPHLPLWREDPADHAPVQNSLAPVPARPVQDQIPRKHPCDTERKREPPFEQTSMAQGAGRHDRHLLRDRDPEAAKQETEKHSRYPKYPTHASRAAIQGEAGMTVCAASAVPEPTDLYSEASPLPIRGQNLGSSSLSGPAAR